MASSSGFMQHIKRQYLTLRPGLKPACKGRVVSHRCAAATQPEPTDPTHPQQAGDPRNEVQQQQQQQELQQQQPSRLSEPSPPGSVQQATEQEQLWWVERFEAKRKQLEEQQPPQQQHRSSNDEVTAAAKAGAATETSTQHPEVSTAVPWPRIALQLLQLTVAVAALILWPASLYRSGLYSGKVWLLFWTYMLFFGGGTVWRLVQFGPLASRKKDQQSKTLATRAAWLLFIGMMPVLHWGCIGSYIKSRAAAAAAAAAQQGSAQFASGPASSLALYDVIGLGLLAGAVGLNWAAARHLGKAYDRVVQPDALVTSGPYAWVQHPIYSSYMMLFCGYAMVLHSFGYALLALVVCLVYYRSRVALEGDVLQQAFGKQYRQYQQRTKLFVPCIL